MENIENEQIITISKPSVFQQPTCIRLYNTKKIPNFKHQKVSFYNRSAAYNTEKKIMYRVLNRIFFSDTQI